jgi:hypothetical protein
MHVVACFMSFTIAHALWHAREKLWVAIFFLDRLPHLAAGGPQPIQLARVTDTYPMLDAATVLDLGLILQGTRTT